MHDVYQAQVYSNYRRRHTGQSLEDEAMQMQISIERARQPGWTSPGRGEGGAVAGDRKQVAGVAGDEEWGGLAGHRAKVASQTGPLQDCQLPTMQHKVAPQFVFCWPP